MCWNAGLPEVKGPHASKWVREGKEAHNSTKVNLKHGGSQTFFARFVANLSPALSLSKLWRHC